MGVREGWVVEWGGGGGGSKGWKVNVRSGAIHGGLKTEKKRGRLEGVGWGWGWEGGWGWDGGV